jgi:gliding motility-associated-like protein
MPVGGTLPYDILWSNGDTVNALSGLSPAAISVTVTDANGCVVSGSAIINEPAALIATVQNYVNPNCGNTNDGSVTATVNGGTSPYNYNWSNGDTTSVITDLGAGSYTLTVVDSHLCSDTLLQILVSSTTITDSITSGIGSDNMGFASLTVTGGTPIYSYLWSHGATNANVSGLTPGMYYVTITDANSCFIVDSVAIDIPLIIPSVITPNGDHTNDDFEIVGIGGYVDISIEIYNRWGDLLFIFSGTGSEYVSESNRWNGQYQGKDLPMGSYVYIIRLGENIDPVTGVVSIIR